jgi:hypothetical protein
VEIGLYIAAIWVVAIMVFDVLPYCLATIFIGRFPPGGPFVWHAFKLLRSKFRRYPTWKDIK